MADNEISVALVGQFDSLDTAMQSAASSVESGAASIQTALSSISGASAQVEQSANSAAQALNSVSKVEPPDSGGWFSMASAMAVGVASGEALLEVLKKIGEGLKEAIFGAAELAEKLHNMSESTGISVDGLERLRYASELAGKDFENLQRGVTQLALKMLELQAGASNPALQTAMQRLGLTPEQLSDSEHALDNIAEAWNRVGDSIPKQEKIGAIREILGRQGADFIPVLEKLDEANAKFDALNIGLGGAADSALKAQEAMNELGASWERLKEGAGALAAGPLTAVSNRLTEIVTVARQLASGDFSSYTNPLANKSAIDAAISGKVGGNKDQSTGGAGAGDTNSLIQAMVDARQKQIAQGVTGREPGDSPATDTKKSLAQDIADFEAAQREIVAAAGDTASARMAMEENIVAFLKSKESEAAALGVDLSKQEGVAQLAAAAAQKANTSEIDSANREAESKIASSLRQRGEYYDQYYRDIQSLARATASGDLEIEGAQINLVRAQLAQDYQDHVITKDQETEALKKALQEEYEAKDKALADEMDLLTKGTAAYQTALDKRVQLNLQYQTAQVQAETKDDKTNSGPLAGLGTSVSSQADKAFTQLTTRATTAKQFLQQTFQDISSDFIHLVTKMVGDSAAFASVTTALKGIFASVGPSATQALSELNPIKEAILVAKAGEAAGAQFANVITTVPFPENLVLAPSAAAAAFAGTFAAGQGSAEEGAVLGSSGMLMSLHPEEMVLPAPLSKGIQSIIQNGGDGGAVHFHVHAMDVSGIAGFFEKNKGHLADALVSAKRAAHPSIAELRR